MEVNNLHTVFVLTGGNLGDRSTNIAEARKELAKLGEIEDASAVYETEAWEMEGSPDVLNQVVKLHTQLGSYELLSELEKIEAAFPQRSGEGFYKDRYMDLDILYYDDDFVDDEQLQIPHPKMHQRRFTLVPLNDIAPEFYHPVRKVTNRQLLEECEDDSVVKYFSAE